MTFQLFVAYLLSVIVSTNILSVQAAPLPVNHESEFACMACVNQNPQSSSDLVDLLLGGDDNNGKPIQMFSFARQECIDYNSIAGDGATELNCPPLERCCFDIKCCVTDGCRAPRDMFYFETQETGEFSQTCDECCDHISPDHNSNKDDNSSNSTGYYPSLFPLTDVSQLFGNCNSVAATTNADDNDQCEMNVHYADKTIQVNVQMDGNTAVVSTMVSGDDDESDLPQIKHFSVTSDNDSYYLEGLDDLAFGPNVKDCSSIQSYAMHQHELLLEEVTSKEDKTKKDSSVFPYFEDSQDSTILCNTYGKTLIYYAARQWLNFTEVVVAPTIGTDGVYVYETESLKDASPFVQLCQTRSFTDRLDQSFDATLTLSERGGQSGDSTTWYNTIVQEECVSTYQYPPSCPKCAMCSKHDELNALQLMKIYGQVEENRVCSKDVCDKISENDDANNEQQQQLTPFVENDPSICKFDGKPDTCECFCMRLAVLLKRCPHLQDTFANQISNVAPNKNGSTTSSGSSLSHGSRSTWIAVIASLVGLCFANYAFSYL